MAEPIASNDFYTATAGEVSTVGAIYNFFGMDFDFGGLLKNDTDADGDQLEVVAVQGQALTDGSVSVAGDNGGTFIILSNGQITFDGTTGFEYLAAGETADTTITYVVSDGTSTTTATATVTVTGIDGDAIVAVDDTFSVSENDVLTDSVLANDVLNVGLGDIVAVNGDISGVDSPIAGSNGGLFTIDSNGQLTFDTNGEFDYLDEGEIVTTTITYTAQAGSEQTVGTVTIEVIGTNDVPVTSPESNQTPNLIGENYQVFAESSDDSIGEIIEVDVEGTLIPLDFGLLDNDSDPDGDVLTISAVDGQALVNGTISIAGDNGGLFIINEDGTAFLDASSGFELLRGGETIDTSVTYTVTDGLASGDATVTVTVVGSENDAIFQADDFGTTDQNTASSGAAGFLFANDTSVDGTFIISNGRADTQIDGSRGGVFVLGSDGSYTFDPDGDFDWLSEGQSVFTSVAYDIENSRGEEDYDQPATADYLTIEVTGTNDAVTAVDDSYEVAAGEIKDIAKFTEVSVGETVFQVDGTVLSNDSDIDRNDTLTLIEVNGQALVNGTITVAGDNGGQFTISELGEVTFDSTVGTNSQLAEGETGVTQATYTVSDGNGSTDQGTISVTMVGINDAPVAVADDLGIVYRGGDLEFSLSDLLGNDFDVDNNSSFSLDSITGPDKGELISLGAGNYLFRTNADFDALGDGQTELVNFSYTIIDEFDLVSDAGTVSLTVDGSNVGPVANDDTYEVVAGEVETVGQVLNVGSSVIDLSVVGNDKDGNNDQLSVSNAGGQSTATGPVTVTGDNGGLFTVAEDGTVTFDASTGFETVPKETTVTTSIQYTVTDGNGGTDTATISVVVTGTLDRSMTAEDDSIDIDENEVGLVLDVLANDEDPDLSDGLSVASFDGGTVADNLEISGGELVYNSGTAFDSLALNESTSVSFTYTAVSDGGSSDTATVTLNITGENDAPVVVADLRKGVFAGETLEIDTAALIVNDVDVDNGSTISFSGFDAPSVGSLVDNGDGTFSFETGSLFETLTQGEKEVVTLTYTISDEHGATATGTLDVDVFGVNDAPVGVDDTGFSVSEDDVLSLDGSVLISNDTDVDSNTVLSVTGFDDPIAGTIIDNGDGTFDYDSEGAFDYLTGADQADITLTYTVSDQFGGTSTANVEVTITGANDAPVAVNDEGFSFGAVGTSTITVAELLSNDTDADDGAVLSLVSVSTTTINGASITLDSGSGLITFDPTGVSAFEALSSGQTLSDSFTYTVEDEFGASAVGEVNIVVQGVNDAPVASDYDVTVSEENTIVIDTALLLSSFTSDVDDGDVISFVSLANPGAGQGDLTDNGDGTFTYDPTVAYDGLSGSESELVSLDYTVQDLDGELATASVNITVQGFDDV